MEDGKVNKALKLLGSSNKGGILPLTEETFEVLLEKHRKSSEASLVVSDLRSETKGSRFESGC